MFYHLGGNGPWIAKVDGVVGNDISPPEDCSIQQVHMVRKLINYDRGLAS